MPNFISDLNLTIPICVVVGVVSWSLLGKHTIAQRKSYIEHIHISDFEFNAMLKDVLDDYQNDSSQWERDAHRIPYVNFNFNDGTRDAQMTNQLTDIELAYEYADYVNENMMWVKPYIVQTLPNTIFKKCVQHYESYSNKLKQQIVLANDKDSYKVKYVSDDIVEIQLGILIYRQMGDDMKLLTRLDIRMVIYKNIDNSTIVIQ